MKTVARSSTSKAFAAVAPVLRDVRVRAEAGAGEEVVRRRVDRRDGRVAEQEERVVEHVHADVDERAAAGELGAGERSCRAWGCRCGAATTPWRSTGARSGRQDEVLEVQDVAALAMVERDVEHAGRPLAPPPPSRPPRRRCGRSASPRARAGQRSRAAIAIGARRNVGTATLTASRPSSSSSSSAAGALVIDRVLRGERLAGGLLEPRDRHDAQHPAPRRRPRCAELRPPEPDDPDAQLAHANQPRGDSGLPGTGRRGRRCRGRPLDRVGDHAPDVGTVVDGVVLIARAEVEDPAQPAPEAAAAAEHLAAGERS